ncbi:MAG: MmcQ/YjbR family DNA-binding protein [Gemmatimonadales bacterium]
MPSTFATARRVALEFPGVEEGLSYGTAALKVRGKLMARLKEDGETLVVRVTPTDRDLLLQFEPSVFFITDHYRNHPRVLVRLRRIGRRRLSEVLEEAWRLVAPRRLQAEYDGEGRPRTRARPD